MGQISIACYRPKQGKEAALESIVRGHVQRLRDFGLATDRAPIIGRAKDGTIVEVFEWNSSEAIAEAHQHPGVHKMWAEFGDACDCVSFGSLAEAQDMFAGLTPL
jgi:hypothetical protein